MSRHPLWRLLFPCVGLFALFAASTASAQPRLVADLNSSRVPANLQPFPSLGIERDGVLYFPATDPQHGYELWRSDGTAEGTFRLADLCPGPCYGGGSRIGLFDGYVYFYGYDREHGTEIWRTDGTVGGEELLGDLCPGACGIGLAGWVERDGALWFLTQESGKTPVLWTSDGTPSGTRRIADLCDDLGLCGFADFSYAFLTLSPSGQDFILGVSIADVRTLYRTDGTPEGTEVLHRFATPALAPEAAPQGGRGRQAAVEFFLGRPEPAAARIAEAGEPLFFLDGYDLWTSDGTPEGTRFVRNVRSLIGLSTYPQSVLVAGGVWYAIFDNGDWLRSDGTAAGTFPLPAVASQFRPTLAQIGAVVFAVTTNGVWRAGATAESTVRIDGPLGDVLVVVERPGRLFVMGWLQSGFVWSTDGTEAGTRRYHVDGPPNPDQYEIGAFGDGAMFSVGYRELWRADSAGARRVREFVPDNSGSGPIDQISFGDRLLFLSNPSARGAKLFTSDGTATGTRAISSVLQGPASGFDHQPEAYRLSKAGGRAFFTTYGQIGTSDGTPEGTRLFGLPLSSSSHRLTAPIGVVGDRFVFGANFRQYPLRCDPGDTEPWSSDGTARGTRRILNVNPFEEAGHSSQCETVPLSSSPGPGVSFGSFALFAADDLLHGRELFASDGTGEGTRLVADLNPRRKRNPQFTPGSSEFGPERIGVGSDPSDLVRAGNRAFFVADDGTTGRELWVSNGQRRGTRRVADLVPGRVGSAPHDLVAVGEDLYFFAANPAGESGEGLYRTDGTRRGTIRVSDLAGVSQAAELTLVRGGRLFFTAFTAETGTELWTSEGTAATTRRVADLRPGPRGAQPQNLKAVGSRVIFAADDGASGLEPWSSDGTAAGTVRRGDLAPGSAASGPGPFTLVRGQLFFGADDGEHGRELWAVPVAEVTGESIPDSRE